MARTLSNGLQDFFADRPGAEFASWCVIELPLLQGSPSATSTDRFYYLATSEITIDGKPYDPQLRRLSEITRTTGRAAETITLSIQNITTEFGAVLLKDVDVLHGATVRAGRWWRDPKSGAEWHEQQFSGIVENASGNEQEVTLSCLSDLYAAQSVGGGKVVDKLCPLTFNSPKIRASGSGLGDACGYTGGDTECEHTSTDCIAKGNYHRFGGFVQLESSTTSATAALQGTVANYSLIQDNAGDAIAPQKVVQFVGASVTDDSGDNRTLVDVRGGNAPNYIHAVLDYGVQADPGTDTVDTTTTLQAALNASASLKRPLYLPTGTYRANLTVPDDAALFGDGPKQTILKGTGSDVAVLDATSGGSRFALRDIQIRGTATNSTAAASVPHQHGFFQNVLEIADLHFQRVLFYQLGGAAMKTSQVFSSVFELIESDYCYAPASFDIRNGPGTTFISPYVHSLGKSGLAGYIIRTGGGLWLNPNGIDGPTGISDVTTWMIVGSGIGTDGVSLSGLSISSGSTTLTASSAQFHPYDVGQTVQISGAGSGGGTLYERITAYVSATQVTIANAAGATVSSVSGSMGIDGNAYPVLMSPNVEAHGPYGIVHRDGSTSIIDGYPTFVARSNATNVKDISYEGNNARAQRGLITSNIVFASDFVGATYANSQPIHSVGLIPARIVGPANTSSVAVSGTTPRPYEYYDSSNSRAERITRLDNNFSRKRITGNYTQVSNGDSLIECNHSAPVTVTLMNAANAGDGFWLLIKDVSGSAATNPITISPSAGTIDGAASKTINLNYGSLLIYGDGTIWRTMADDSSKRVIGTVGTLAKFTSTGAVGDSIITEGGSGVSIAGYAIVSDLYADTYSSSPSAASSINLRRHRGTSGSPAAIQSGDVIGYIPASGQYDTTAGHRNAGAYIYPVATENYDSTHAGTKWVISAAPNGSTDGFNQKWEIDPNNGLKLPGGTYLTDTYACRVYATSNTLVNNTSWATIAFDAERRDDGSLHSTVTNTDRVTVPLAGWYHITGNVEFAANTTGDRIVRVRVNASTEIARVCQLAAGTYGTVINIGTLYYLSANDYLTLEVFQSSGGNLNVLASSNYSPEFMVRKVI